MAGEEHYARALSWLRMDLPKTPAAALKEWKRAGDLADVDPAVNEDRPAAEGGAAERRFRRRCHAARRYHRPQCGGELW